MAGISKAQPGGRYYKWFAFHKVTKDVQKIQALPAERFKQWVNLLCCTDDDGNLPTVEGLVWELRLQSTEQVIEQLEYFASKNLIDNRKSGYRMHDWEEFQPSGIDRTNAERQRRFREAHRQKGPAQFNLPAPEADTPDEAVDASESITSADSNVTNNGLEEEKEKYTNPPTPLPLRPVQPLPAESVSAEPEWESCWNQFEAAYPEGYLGSPIPVSQEFVSLIGLPAPRKNGLNSLSGTGMPTAEYFAKTVLPSLKAAVESQDWAPDKDSKRYIPSASKFLKDRMWMRKWKKRADSVERKAPAPSSDGSNPYAEYRAPWREQARGAA